MRLIDADKLIKEVNDNKELRESERVYLEGLLLNAPTVEEPEKITIKCDTEEDRQKLISAFRNAKLKLLVEEERPTDELNRVKNELNNELKGHYLTNCQNCKSDYSRGYDDGYAEGYKDGMTGADWKGEEK